MTVSTPSASPSTDRAALLSDPRLDALANPIVWMQNLARGSVEPLPPSPELIWAEQVQLFGSTLQALRQQLGWSIPQLYVRSYVPQYHLRSLEAGLVDQLPSPIFVRGFMKRIVEALGVDGAALQVLIPERLPEPVMVPTWIDRIAPPSLQPSHLYAGYAAILVGSVGAISMNNPTQAYVPTGELQADQPAPLRGEPQAGDRLSQRHATEQAMRLKQSLPLGRQIPEGVRPES